MTIEQKRISDLEDALRCIREACAYNLEEPGNENDTLDFIVREVTSTLKDNYKFDMAAYLGDD